MFQRHQRAQQHKQHRNQNAQVHARKSQHMAHSAPGKHRTLPGIDAPTTAQRQSRHQLTLPLVERQQPILLQKPLPKAQAGNTCPVQPRQMPPMTGLTALETRPSAPGKSLARKALPPQPGSIIKVATAPGTQGVDTGIEPHLVTVADHAPGGRIDSDGHHHLAALRPPTTRFKNGGQLHRTLHGARLQAGFRHKAAPHLLRRWPGLIGPPHLERLHAHPQQEVDKKH